jgi:glycosyltransferase involved in cell wall biosynthesis
MSNHEKHMRVSVIITTKNSSKTIAACLDSIIAQTYKNIEVLVVDGLSTDNTIHIVQKYDVKIFPMSGERTRAKNFGLTNSSSDFVLFVDSDMVLEKTVIEECVAVIPSDVSIGGVIIPERTIGNGFWVKVRDFERKMYYGTKIESARFFKKELAVRVGGFDEDVVFYEESILPQKIEELGYSVTTRIRAFISHDENNFDLLKWLRKKRYYSKSSQKYIQSYPSYAKLQFGVSYRIKSFTTNGNWKLLVRQPVLTLGLFILKTLEYCVSKF